MRGRNPVNQRVTLNDMTTICSPPAIVKPLTGVPRAVLTVVETLWEYPSQPELVSDVGLSAVRMVLRTYMGGKPLVAVSGRGQQVSGWGQQVSGWGQQVSGRGQQVSGRGQQVSGRRQQVSGRVQQVSGRRQQAGLPQT